MTNNNWSGTCPGCGSQSSLHQHRPLFAGEKETEAQIARNGLVCSIWGPPKWYDVHTTTFGFPAEPTPRRVAEYKQLVKSWGHGLPCCCCRNNYSKHLKKLMKPAVFASRQAFTQFGFDLHNEVNHELGKPRLGPKDFAKLRRFYESGRAGRDHSYGHAFVVVKERRNVPKNTHTIQINPKCVMK
jgi:hypothetical protein